MPETKTKKRSTKTKQAPLIPTLQRLFDMHVEEKVKLKELQDERKAGLSNNKQWRTYTKSLEETRESRKKIEVDYDERLNPGLKESIDDAKEKVRDAKQSFDIEALTLCIRNKGEGVFVEKNGKRVPVQFKTSTSQLSLF